LITKDRQYIGDFKNGLADGEGVIIQLKTFDDHVKKLQMYMGDFKAGKYSGGGYYAWPSGTRIVGTFEDGNPKSGAQFLMSKKGNDNQTRVLTYKDE